LYFFCQNGSDSRQDHSMNGRSNIHASIQRIDLDTISIGGGGYTISRTKLKQILDKIIRDAETSFVKGSNAHSDEPSAGQKQNKRKTASFRICPMCDKSVGNFGNNFKNHFSSCCPVRFNILLPTILGSL
jgi:hypothetical protein